MSPRFHFPQLLWLLLPTMAVAKPRELQLHTAEAGAPPGYWLTISYDGSQHRTAAWGLVPSTAISLTESLQVGLYANASTGEGLHWQWQENLYAGAWLSWDLGDAAGCSWELETELSGPSLMSDRGMDVQFTLTAARSFGDSWFCGLAGGTALATTPLDGDKAGYLFASGWLGYATGWLEDDHISAGFYTATHESPDYGPLFVLETRYTVPLGEHLELTLAVGREVASPYEHKAFYTGFTLTTEF